MAKFNFKGFGKDLLHDGKDVLLIGTGIVATQKFADFKTLFPNVDPAKVWMKHEGAIKFGAALITLAAFKKMPGWLQCLVMGVAIQGGIKELRTLTMNDAGESFVKSIGDGDYNQQINDLAEEIKKAGMSGPYVNPTGQGYSAVSGPFVNPTGQGYSAVSGGDRRPDAVLLNQNSQTGVAGMGMDEIE
jgi:hypothetical protein